MRIILLFAWLIGCDKAETPRNMEGDAPGECTDRADNDQDGTYDCEDSDCFASPDCKGDSKSESESNSKPKEKTAVERKAGDILTSELGVKTVYVPPGTFIMGSPESEKRRNSNESQHQVTLTRGFHMMQSEVTQALYQKVMGENPSHFNTCGSNCPVESVSWFDMVRFVNALSKKEGLETCYRINDKDVSWPKGIDCTGWRLPTEAEWEYAARGGKTHRYSGSNDLESVGWYFMNSNSTTHPVCQKKKNGYGLCDMSGNVWEWVWDWHGDYPTGAVIDPTGPSSASHRVIRGGSLISGAVGARVADRNGDSPPWDTYSSVGARLVRTAEQ